jgi:hypothetical protein
MKIKDSERIVHTVSYAPLKLLASEKVCTNNIY